MGRSSKLTEKQWAEIGRRLTAGEPAAMLAKEFGIDRAAISRKFSQQVKTVKSVANQLLAAEVALHALPIAQQLSAITLADQLRSISGHLAGAANYGAATAHRLAGIANGRVAQIDDATPLDEDGMVELKAIAVLTRMANDAAEIPLNLLKANKEVVDTINKRDEPLADMSMKIEFVRA